MAVVLRHRSINCFPYGILACNLGRLGFHAVPEVFNSPLPCWAELEPHVPAFVEWVLACERLSLAPCNP